MEVVKHELTENAKPELLIRRLSLGEDVGAWKDQVKQENRSEIRS